MLPTLKSICLTTYLIGVNVLFAYVLSWLEAWAGFLTFGSSTALIIGTLLLIAGAVIRFWSALAFYQAEIKVVYVVPQAELVTSGPFALSRNPLYIGILLISLGSALIFGTPSGVVASIILLALFNAWAGLEEKQLTEKFGTAYLAYKERVRRWL